MGRGAWVPIKVDAGKSERGMRDLGEEITDRLGDLADAVPVEQDRSEVTPRFLVWVLGGGGAVGAQQGVLYACGPGTMA